MENMNNNKNYYFHLVDYIIFGVMLFLSALTGLYYGCRHRYCKSGAGPTLRDYLTANRSMKPFPVAMSLVASYVSGVTILGTPSEVYNFGGQYFLIAIAICLSGVVVATVYLPVFTKLQVNSSYEYLELRYDKTVRTIASVFFVMDEIMFLPVIIYVPSLAFNQVTGIDLHLIGTIVCVVCVFYTVLGGIRAVVWTDTWQILVMFISVVVIVILGVIADGGPGKIVEVSKLGQRLDVANLNPSMYDRYTVFGVIIGGFCYWTAFNSVNQTMVQRYMALPTDKEAKISVGLFTIGVTLFVLLCCYSGILVYTHYYGCDPLMSGRIKADDQMLPLYVMETVGHLRGVPGLFIAGVFGAALSSLSVVLNSTSLVFIEDFLKACCNINLSETKGKFVAKAVVVVLGLLSIAFLYVVEHLGGVLPLASSLSAIAAGTTFGIFSLGMLIPWANTKGAIVGGLAGAIMSGLVSFGGQFVGASNLVVPHKLPVLVDQCFAKYGINATAIVVEYPDESSIFPLFRLSYLWITPIGASTVIIIGFLVSLCTGKTDLQYLDPELISPISQWMLPKESERLAGSATRKIRHKDADTGPLVMTNMNFQPNYGNIGNTD